MNELNEIVNSLPTPSLDLIFKGISDTQKQINDLNILVASKRNEITRTELSINDWANLNVSLKVGSPAQKDAYSKWVYYKQQLEYRENELNDLLSRFIPLQEKLALFQQQISDYYTAVADAVGSGLSDSGDEGIDVAVVTSVVQQIEANASTYKRKKAILYMGGMAALSIGIIVIIILIRKL